MKYLQQQPWVDNQESSLQLEELQKLLLRLFSRLQQLMRRSEVPQKDVYAFSIAEQFLLLGLHQAVPDQFHCRRGHWATREDHPQEPPRRVGATHPTVDLYKCQQAGELHPRSPAVGPLFGFPFQLAVGVLDNQKHLPLPLLPRPTLQSD